MRVARMLLASAILASAGPAAGQAWIGGVVGNLMERGSMKWCFDGTAKHNAKAFANQAPYADQAMDKYLGLARTTASLDKMFTGTREHRVMVVDGAQVDPQTARDPWAEQTARLDRVGLVQSNDTQNFHGLWRAVAINGAPLGTYDVLLRAGVGGYHIRQVSLISAGSPTPPSELKPFCNAPGDVEKWQEAQARREAVKAARAAQ